ncbi:MAG: CheR family methyltransferase [Anaeromyxobacter sp.]
MSERNRSSVNPNVRLSESEWRDLSRMVQDSAGIKLSEAKRVFLVSRLLRRLRATGVRTFREYFTLVRRSQAYTGEHQQLVNAVTTNKTDFFREQEHFHVLARWLEDPSPEVHQARMSGIRVWCAAASTGEEPYTIAAVLRERLSDSEYERASIVASDIDTQVLETARRGVYDQSALETLDAAVRMKMFVHGSLEYQGKFRVRRELRDKVRFVQQNLVGADWRVGSAFDIVFCRNVLIYFDRGTQQHVVERLLERTEPHGLLFLGHAESLNALSISAKPVAHSVYARVDRPSLRLRASRKRPAGTSELLSVHMPCVMTTEKTLSLKKGEARRDSHLWSSVSFSTSLLLVLSWEGDEQGMVFHLDARVSERVSADVRAAIGEFHRATTAPNETAVVRVKALTDRGGLEALVAEALEECGANVVALRTVGAQSQAWVPPGSNKVLLARAGGDCRTESKLKVGVPAREMEGSSR